MPTNRRRWRRLRRSPPKQIDEREQLKSTLPLRKNHSASEFVYGATVNIADAENLLAAAVPRHTGSWADMGAGTGTFARALARRLESGSRIYAVDRDAGAISALPRGITEGVEIIPMLADFTRPLSFSGSGVSGLDGLLFANSLHFVTRPHVSLSRLTQLLRPGGSVVIVEYDGRRPSRWVPHPIPAAHLPEIAAAAGLAPPAITATRRSAYGGSLYVAVTTRGW